MRQIITSAVVLSRTNFGEADRILTLMTADQGKVRVMARGVRKERSKLAGGVELFSISEIGFLRGRGEIATLTTSRLKTHFGNIVRDIDRTSAAYEFLKQLNTITEDNAGHEFFELLEQTLHVLDNSTINLTLVKFWFDIQLLEITGHSPNLSTDTAGHPLQATSSYNFDLEKMAFMSHPEGLYSADHIKLLRLSRSNVPDKLHTVQGIEKVIKACQQLSATMRKHILKI